MDQWQALVNTVMKLRVPQKARNFLIYVCDLVSQERLLHGVKRWDWNKKTTISNVHRTFPKLVSRCMKALGQLEDIYWRKHQLLRLVVLATIGCKVNVCLCLNKHHAMKTYPLLNLQFLQRIGEDKILALPCTGKNSHP